MTPPSKTKKVFSFEENSQMKASQHEIESAFYRLLAFGDELKIAQRIGKSASLVSQQWSPDADRDSNIYKAILELSALMAIDGHRGRRALRTFCHFVELSAPTATVEVPDCDEELTRCNKEVVDVVDAHIRRLSKRQKLMEIDEAMGALQTYRDSVVGERAA